MKPKYIQINCKETAKLDLRQANAILKYKPNIIILEYPNNNRTPDLIFNKYDALMKPKAMVRKRLQKFPEEILKIHPWVKADQIMWKNVANLWAKDHQILIYAVDAPSELTSEWLDIWKNSYLSVKKNWIWWVQIYLRERIMANNIKWILHNYKADKNPITLIFLQRFHWDHVKFLLNNPSKKEIWNYYFGKFTEINGLNIAIKIKNSNKIFYKYWKKFSDF